jgi:hypothetical protein
LLSRAIPAWEVETEMRAPRYVARIMGSALLIAVYLTVACDGAEDDQFAHGPATFSPSPASPTRSLPSPTPVTSADNLFDSMLESFTNPGLTLEQQVTGSLDGGLDHVAALFSSQPANTTLVVLERQDSVLENLIERRVEGQPPSVGASTWLFMQDADGDGDDELFVRVRTATMSWHLTSKTAQSLRSLSSHPTAFWEAT